MVGFSTRPRGAKETVNEFGVSAASDSLHMRTKREATIDDLRKVEGKAEIVDGELVLMPAAGGLHSYAAGQVFASLREYQRRTNAGYAIPDNAGFVVNLPNRRSFSPDAAFYLGTLTADFMQGAPVFAVEVRSPGDFGPTAEDQMARKRRDYFAAGTLVVWDVDVLRERVVRCYRPENPESPAVF